MYFFVPNPETQEILLQLQTLTCLGCCSHSNLSVKRALRAWVCSSKLLPERGVCLQEKSSRVYPLALKSHTKLAAAPGHEVIEHLCPRLAET